MILHIELLDKKFASFGFDVHHVKGTDTEDLISVFDSLDTVEQYLTPLSHIPLMAS